MNLTPRRRVARIAGAVFGGVLAVAAFGYLHRDVQWVPTAHAEEKTVIQQKLLSAQSALNAVNATKVGAGQMSRCRESAIYIVWSAGVTAGAVKVESAVDENYTGTWAPLATVTTSAASSQDIVQITGVHWAIRTRISTAVANGTVTSWIVCN